ncbi:MAG: hypothetical protein U0163_09015 [Gemmatimonadaceae bacterium]
MRVLTSFALVACITLATACVDAPSSPSTTADENVLASSLDALSREAAQQGDTERSQEFTWAALAVRSGVTPSKFQIKSGGTLAAYEAIVYAVTWQTPASPQRAPDHRSLLAWRRSGSSLQTLMISTTADVQPVQNPLSATPLASLTAPFAGAHVLYSVRGDAPGTWVGVSGNVKVAQGSVSGACVPVTSDKRLLPGVTCQQVTYTVGFEVATQPAVGAAHAPLADSALLRLGANDQAVNGAKLLLACSAPTTNGC